MKMRRFGLIGFPLSHSFSPGYFTAKFQREGILDAQYDAFPLSRIEDFRILLEETPDLKGLNVTIPYKSSVIPFLDELSEEAQSIGAVNVIKITESKLIGYNSDAYGFEQSLLKFLPHPIPTSLNALVLGTGGASKAVVFVLKKLGVPFQMVSRKGMLCYEEITAEILQNQQLIINTTPLGMAPHLDECPELPYASVTNGHYFYDLIYNPEKTKFLTLAETAGAFIQNGLPMLHLQAEKAWEIWGVEN